MELFDDEVIIKEYLCNWFNYEDLSKYLCVDLKRIKEVLDNPKYISEKYGLKTLDNIRNHKLYMTRFDSNEKDHIVTDKDRYIISIANFIINNRASIRVTAKEFGIGKTTVFDYINEILPNISINKYRSVFDVLMENKSYSVKNKKVIEQVLLSFDLLEKGFTSKEICEALDIGRNVLQRNLDTRLKKIDQVKYKRAKVILDNYKESSIKEHQFKSKVGDIND